MTDIRGTEELLVAADPLASPSSHTKAGLLSAADLLERIDERSRPVTGTLQSKEQTQERHKPDRRRGLLVAAAAAAIVVIVGVLLFAFLGPSDRAPVVTQPQETVPVGPSPSTAPTTPPTDPDALGLVTAFYDAYRIGDIDAMEALFGPEYPYYSSTDVQVSTVRSSQLLSISESRFDVTCDAGGPNQVVCRESYASAFTSLDPVYEATITWRVEEGLIVDAAWRSDEFGSPFYIVEEQAGIDLYRQWVLENHPDEMDTLFFLRETFFLGSVEARELHMQYIAEFRESAGN